MKADLKLILLPGLDGTGQLFHSLLGHLPDFESDVISLPNSRDQSYSHQLEFLEEKLPEGDFVLLAESFSGPTAAMLAEKHPKNLKGIIFVATFLRAPSPILAKLASLVPVPKLLNLPGAKTLLKHQFLESPENGISATHLHDTLRSLDHKIIEARLDALSNIPKFNFKSELPAIYLQARKDTIVPATCAEDFKSVFSRLEIRELPASHLLLQSYTESAAKIISEFISSLR